MDTNRSAAAYANAAIIVLALLLGIWSEHEQAAAPPASTHATLAPRR